MKRNSKKITEVIILRTEFGEFMFNSDFEPLSSEMIYPVVTIFIDQSRLFSEEDLEEMRCSYTEEMIKERFSQALIYNVPKILREIADTGERIWKQRTSGND